MADRLHGRIKFGDKLRLRTLLGCWNLQDGGLNLTILAEEVLPSDWVAQDRPELPQVL